MSFFNQPTSQPISAYVDRGSVEIADTLRKRYAENFAAADELQAQLDTLNSTNFEGDLALRKELETNTRAKLDQLATRGDYENLSLAVAKSNRDFQKQYQPISDNYNKYQEYVADVQKKYDEGIIDAETYQAAVAASAHDYKGLQLDQQGNVDRGSFFTGMNLVKDVNIVDLVNDAAKGMIADKSERENAQVAQGPGGSLVITTSQGVETISADRVQSIYNEVVNRPDVKAALKQKGRLRTYNLSDEDKAAALVLDMENLETQMTNMEKALQSSEYSADQKVAIRMEQNNIQTQIDELKDLQERGADLTTYVQNRTIQGILSPIEEAVFAKNVYTKVDESYKEGYDPVYMAHLKDGLARQREIDRENRKLDTGIISIAGPNVVEYSGPSSFEEFTTGVADGTGGAGIEGTYSAIETQQNIVRDPNSSAEMKANAEKQIVQLRNDLFFQAANMQAVFEAAKAKHPNMSSPNFANPNWYKGMSDKDKEYFNEELQDEESPMYASRRAEGEFITSGDPEYNKFEKGLMNYLSGGLPYSMKGYVVPPEGNVDIGFNPDKTLGQLNLAGLKVEDISISASGIAGGVSGPQDYLILNLSGKVGDEDKTGTQVMVPITQFEGSDFYQEYTTGAAYNLGRRMDQARLAQAESAPLVATITSLNAEGEQVKTNINMTLLPDQDAGDLVRYKGADGVERTVTINELLYGSGESSGLADGNIVNIDI